MYSVGVDTGGTFTDFVFFDGKNYSVNKLLSTPDDPTKAIVAGLKQHIADTSSISELIHGTTVATNALLERKGALTCLITTKGFEDVLEIKRQNREELYDLFWNPKPALIQKEYRLGITERTDFQGKVLKEIDSQEFVEIIEFIKKNEIECVAVCLLNSYVNPENELVVKKALSVLDIPITLSSTLIPEFREYERTSTTVVNSYLIPKVRNYMNSLSRILKNLDISVIQSSGGMTSTDKASYEPAKIILSGPAGGVVGAFSVSEAAGRNKIISYDMGGTSTDISLCDEKISFTTENIVDGLPIKIPMIDISTIGAGGGSIAFVDEGGVLKVGPESAGADPGPACYGKGIRPTVTDANVVLGRVIPEYFLGGEMNIYPERACHSINSLGFSEFSVEEVAESIIQIANSNMEKALRVISIGKGFDPREFTLVSFGGAGGLHACELAKTLEINEVLFPLNAGTLSAFGMLLADSFKDYSSTQFFIAGEKIYNELEKGFSQLEKISKQDSAKSRLSFERFVDARYKRQSHEISLPFGKNLVRDFHLLHKKMYGYCKEENEIEIVTLRLRAYSLKRKLEVPLITKKASNLKPDIKKVFFEKNKVDFSVFNRNQFFCGFEFNGPSIVLENSSTIFLPPDTFSRVDQYGNIVTKLI